MLDSLIFSQIASDSKFGGDCVWGFKITFYYNTRSLGGDCAPCVWGSREY